VDVSVQEQARVASALAEALPAGATVGLALHDADLRLLLASPSFAALCGRDPAELRGRRPAEVLPPELAAAAEAALAGVLAGGGPAELEHPGGARTWRACYLPVEHEGRRHAGMVVAETTSMSRADAALRRSEQLLAGAQRLAALGHWSWDARSGEARLSPQLLELMGLRPEDREGDRPFLVVAPEERRRLLAEARAAVGERRAYSVRFTARRSDGSLRVIEGRADLVHDRAGEPTGLRGFAQDITDLERAGAREHAVAALGHSALERIELADLEQRAVDAVLEILGVDGCVLRELSEDGSCLDMRASGEADFGGPASVPVRPGSMSERAMTSRQPELVEDWEAMGDVAEALAARRQGARSSAHVVIGGRRRPFGVLTAYSGHPGRFGPEEATFLQTIANVLGEAVERRLAEAEIAELSAARGRLVAQALDAEERARRAISEALHDGPLQELLAAGHDLYGLSGRGGDDEAVERTRDRLGAVVRSLRDVMAALHPTVLQYGGLEAALQGVADQHAAAAGFETEVAVEPEATGRRDELLLSVARELLANAAGHARARRVTVAVRRGAGGVELEVADDGAGIAPGRLHAALAEGGIGIAASRERVEAAGGRLTVEAAPGGGTIALVEVPS
jgi:PAS domain S-box-containing protein